VIGTLLYIVYSILTALLVAERPLKLCFVHLGAVWDVTAARFSIDFGAGLAILAL
jgi:hypothetical protein